jgi:staphylococcal nuclease domain-containing protein 1
MQRDVEIEVENVDKSGGFIGALYLNKTENAAITLAREGLAVVHQFSADGLSWAQQLYDAEVSSIYRICAESQVSARRAKQSRRSAMSV